MTPMTGPIRDVLARRAVDAGTPDLDLDVLVAAGERRLRRRRAAAVVAAAAAVVVVLAMVLVVVTLNGPVRPGGGPVNTPTVDHRPSSPPRQLVYSDMALGTMGRDIHLGPEIVDTGVGFVHLDATDAGFVYAYGAGVWFSDGGAPERIGSHLCGAVPRAGTARGVTQVVVSGNAGSLAAWFECAPGERPDLVVVDTGSHREVARTTVSSCRSACTLLDITRSYVYFDRGSYAGASSSGYRLDARTGRVHPSSPREYAADVAGRARGLVVGDSWRSGTTTNGIGQSFRAAGSRLVPQLYDGSSLRDTRAFDTATGRALGLTLPRSYRPAAGEFLLFEWLDDDTVALAAPGYAVGDILVCQVSDGHCRVAVPAPDEETKRVVAHLPLPG